jgi:hypothetical protein
MSPVDVALGAACVALLGAALALAVVAHRAHDRMRAQQQHTADLRGEVEALRTQVEEMGHRLDDRKTAAGPVGAATRATTGAADTVPRGAGDADYVITFDDAEPRTVATSRVVGTAFGEPLIKVAALSHGVRYALREEKRAHLAYQVRREYRRRRRESRARARAAQRGTTPRTERRVAQ